MQNSAGLPESIFPGTTKDLPGTLTVGQYSDADYNPDDPNTLNYARIVSNETITVPSQSSGGGLKSVYVVNYGPIVLGATAAPLNPAGSLTQLPNYLTINGLPWQAETGDSSLSTAISNRPQDELQDDTKPYQSNFLVDLVHQKSPCLMRPTRRPQRPPPRLMTRK